MAECPVLILEGEGDREAVPYLIREITRYTVSPAGKPIIGVNVPKLSRNGELEKYATYALMRSDGDSVFSALIDGLFGLSFSFVPGSSIPPCLAQCDADGDEVFNAINDVLHMLNFGFVPGSPPILPPHPVCGLESQTDSVNQVGCETQVCP